MIAIARKALKKLSNAERLWLFLDYDGTLADFAPTPDTVTPDPELITLISMLAEKPDIHLAVISGRRLQHIRKLLPVSGIWLAGTYGIELLTPSGEQKDQLDYASIRPVLEQLKPKWESLTSNRPGFYLEDKGWSLAIHARFANEKDAEEILQSANCLAQEIIGNARLHLLPGEKFLEICPVDANKGKTLKHILSIDDFPGALPIFIGDDDKDELAFRMVKVHQGIAIVVAAEARPTQADFYLQTPEAVRSWLTNLLQSRS